MKLSIRLLLVPLGWLLLCAAACAQPPVPAGEVQYYVDAAKGDDANIGADADHPLKTLWAAQKLMDKVPADQRVILNLARGSVWREDLGLPTFRDYQSQVSYRGGRPLLTLRPYGVGDKPTISGLDPLPNAAFKLADPATYPHVWSQRVVPPNSYYHLFQGVLVGGKRYLRQVTLDPASPGNTGGPGFLTQASEAVALAFVNENPDTFYSRDNKDGSWEYFVNAGTNPPQDGLSYEYKVRSSIFPARPWNRWEDVRIIGLNGRNGLQAGGANYWMSMKGVEVLFGATHNMLVLGYRLEDCLSDGGFGSTGFHAHSPGGGAPAVYGTLYDRCTARNCGIAFYDHAKNDRPWVYLRDCVTENAGHILTHGAVTFKSFIIGHRHNPAVEQDQTRPTGGFLGYLTAGENYLEDCVFRFVGKERRSPTWHQVGSSVAGGVTHARMHNCVFYTLPLPPPAAFPPINLSVYSGIKGPVDIEYDHCTLLLDFQGEALDKTHPFYGLAGVAADIQGQMTFKHCIVAVLNAPNMKREAGGGPGVALGLDNRSENFKFVFDNCVLTYIGNLAASAGQPGQDYVFVAPEDLFAGDVGRGDYRVKPGSEADQRDAGYRPGRAPLYRPLADKLAAALPE